MGSSRRQSAEGWTSSNIKEKYQNVQLWVFVVKSTLRPRIVDNPWLRHTFPRSQHWESWDQLYRCEVRAACTKVSKSLCSRLCECCRQAGAEVISNSSYKIQLTYRLWPISVLFFFPCEFLSKDFLSSRTASPR